MSSPVSDLAALPSVALGPIAEAPHAVFASTSTAHALPAGEDHYEDTDDELAVIEQHAPAP